VDITDKTLHNFPKTYLSYTIVAIARIDQAVAWGSAYYALFALSGNFMAPRNCGL
jgi:hypothetical protein